MHHYVVNQNSIIKTLLKHFDNTQEQSKSLELLPKQNIQDLNNHKINQISNITSMISSKYWI